MATAVQKRIKRVLAIHDMSGFGRCALTVVIPVLSAMGIQVIPLPTAIMSTHTGGFTDIYMEDMTHAMKPMTEHWEKLGVKFDAIYSGFIGDTAQADIIGGIIDRFGKEDCMAVVDPVFGDDGALYSTCDDTTVEKMKMLCRKADIITPNLTEACRLTGTEYTDTGALCAKDCREYTDSLLEKCLCFGASRVIITGIPVGGGSISTAGIDKSPETSDTSPFYVTLPRIGDGYPGTGELFTSVMLGKLLRGAGFASAIAFASAYTRDVIDESTRYGTPRRDGVALEPCLDRLFNRN